GGFFYRRGDTPGGLCRGRAGKGVFSGTERGFGSGNNTVKRVLALASKLIIVVLDFISVLVYTIGKGGHFPLAFLAEVSGNCFALATGVR
ncbi:MAG: hypothetical protein J6S75_14005, partial [Thermoguttaceae bacterium]|nr:hypothetical protein [Thermoguttaceae bacterium]